ncbi:pilus assembly protein TadG-related protein [Propionibacteriaceae bacterium G1746]|uniref:pilus assembly protein TadG-related protein n=1 Tax=Aestuariimicrobium sp. G57 TaxID=3418485 RepID=UPI003C26A328
MNRRRNERGAVAIVTAISLVMLVGFAALAIDVGALWWDKKQLQNGADAAALALAQSCAKGTCEADEMGMATKYARGNKNDTKVTVTAISHTSNSVTVEVMTTRTHWFAQVLGTSNSDVAARATATWGGVGGGSILPWVVSMCQVPSESELPKTGVTLLSKDNSHDKPGECTSSHNPTEKIPGGFAWLDVAGASTTCKADTKIGDSVPGITGNAGPSNDVCVKALQNLVGKTVLVPVFDNVPASGKGPYIIAAYAEFEITNYCLNKGQDWYGPADEKCTGSERYITGNFVRMVTLDAVVDDSAPMHGAYGIKLTA